MVFEFPHRHHDALRPDAGATEESPRGLSRRGFLGGSVATSLALATGEAWGGILDGLFKSRFCCDGPNPLGCLRKNHYDVLLAFVEAQLYSLWCGPPADTPHAVADDILRFLSALDRIYQVGACGLMNLIDLYALRHTGRMFAKLSIPARMSLLNQGEFQESPFYCPGERLYPLIRWECDYPLHAGVSALAMVTRLVTNSRPPARMHVGLTWSEPCKQPQRLVHLPAPPVYPDLDIEYDVCVVGSGAGGAVMAARAAEQGKRVLIIETGKWISPDALVERYQTPAGRTEIYPPRGDVVLRELYDNAGLRVAGSFAGQVDSRLDFLIKRRRQQIRPRQSINLAQAKVVGGGPYINNAIHLEIREETWNGWGDGRPSGVSYHDFYQRMQQINRSLGVNQQASSQCAGNRSLIFAAGAAKLGQTPEPTPVAILPECEGCGSDNSADPFGNHIGGLHPYRPQEPNSFLMRALNAPTPAEVAYQMQAVQFQLAATPDAGLRAAELVVEDRRHVGPNCRGPQRRVRAKQFVLAAGAVKSTNLLRQSLCASRLSVRGLGERFTANVGTALYAVYDQPILTPHGGPPEPGITQCFFVDRRTARREDGRLVAEPALENWFHFPGTVALALTGWFHRYAEVMNRYNHIAMAGMVVPTGVRPENRIAADGRVRLELNHEEFELLLAGLERIGQIFLASTTPENGVTFYLPTKALLLDECGRPLTIRTLDQLRSAIHEVRKRGPAFLNLLSTHLQGGNALGHVVSRDTFRLQTTQGEVENLYVADASIFPAGAEINPQLTLKALAMYAADHMLGAAPTPAPDAEEVPAPAA